MDAARVEFLVREDAWAAWIQLKGDKSAHLLEQAAVEYKDDRLVAAYVLETVCEQKRLDDAAAAEAGGGQTKSYEAVGEWKEEFFAPSASADLVTADSWCARAAQLQQQVEKEQAAKRRSKPRSQIVPLRTTP